MQRRTRTSSANLTVSPDTQLGKKSRSLRLRQHPAGAGREPLRGKPIRYLAPYESVAEDFWNHELGKCRPTHACTRCCSAALRGAGEAQDVGQARQGCVHRTYVAHLLDSAEVGALQRARNRQVAHSPHAAEDHRNASTEAFGVEQNGVSDPAHVSVPGADGTVFETQRIADWSGSFLGSGSITILVLQ